MVKTKIRFVDVIYWLAIIGSDLFVYIVLGLLLMGYDDNFDSSKGEYWSLASMNSTEKIIYFALQTWNVINIIGVIYIVHRLYRRTKYGT
jgi:hypothetical protein